MTNFSFNSTKEIEIPKDLFSRIIGQDAAIKIAKIVAKQRRHLLLVGPPGIGKSMIAKAIASTIHKPEFEVSVVHNQSMPERPILKIRHKSKKSQEQKPSTKFGKEVEVNSVPIFVSEKFGLRCRRCADISASNVLFCPGCGAEKPLSSRNPFQDLILRERPAEPMRIQTKRRLDNGKEETITYEKTSDDKIIVLSQDDLKRRHQTHKKIQRKVIVPLSRKLFVQASGASETELLGDIKHDPYGDHPEIGTPAYLRVVPGSIHESHEGVLFVDELSTLGKLQRYLLTAMQEKQFPIVGRNPTSSGASVRVDNVPCDFIFVGATNINDLQYLIPPIRSRIRGEGYELLLNTTMQDNKENRLKIAQFVAQEIEKDGKIPHASTKAVELIITQSINIATKIDNSNGLSLRLRNLAGLIKLAGDLAVLDESELINHDHITSALKNAKSIEQQLNDKYGSVWRAGFADYGITSKKTGSETF